jgi:ABC-type transport system involved in multi-copper enzyme maturation permease subunit
MRPLIIKEWRQSHLLVWLGFLLSAMIAVLYLLWLRRYVKTPLDHENLDGACGFLLLIFTGIVILAATSSLFPSEAGRGTLPLLLSLPLSRSRIWLAKVLAGLSLALAASLLTLVPDAVVIPRALREIRFLLYLPDITMWGLLLFSVTLFWATLLRREISVILASVALCGAVLVTEVAGLASGSVLLGYDELLDVSLWAAALSPAFLFASWVTFTRGELLHTRDTWRLAIVSAGAGLLVVAFILTGASRWAYRYQRSEVKVIRSASAPDNAKAAILTTSASPAPFHRNSTEGWTRLRHTRHRAWHRVVVDLDTGREALVLPDSHLGPSFDPSLHPREIAPAAVSPDGRYLARWPQTWWGGAGGLEVWDLEQRRRIYRGLPDPLRTPMNLGQAMDLSWSPRADWLAIGGYTYHAPAPGPGQTPAGLYRQALCIMRPDGSALQQIDLDEFREDELAGPPRLRGVSGYAWAPDGSALYTLEWGGRILRHPLPGDRAGKVWEPPVPGVALPAGAEWQFHTLSVSPTGRWLVVRASAAGPAVDRSRAVRPRVALLVASDGSRVIRLGDRFAYEYVWSDDGRSLYMIVAGGKPFSLLRWEEGQGEPKPIALPPGFEGGQVHPMKGGGLLVWGKQACIVDARGRAALPSDPRLRSLPGDCELITVDSRGRAIVLKDNHLDVADFAADTITRIYP